MWHYREELFKERVGLILMKMEKWGVHSGSGMTLLENKLLDA